MSETVAAPLATPGGAVLRVGADGGVALVESGDPHDVPAALRLLAAGALAAAAGELRLLAAGAPVLRVLIRPDEATALLVTEPLEVLPHELSRRELDVLTLLVAGLPNAAIARRLAIGARTVGTHVDRVLRKLGVETRAAAATRALDEGLVVVPLPGGDDGFAHLRLGRALAAAVGSERVPGRRAQVVRRRALRLGAAVPLTGIAAGDGQEMVRGAGLAVAEINAAGGVGGRPVDLRVVDVDPQDADAVRSGFAALLDDDVDVLTSGYLARQDVAHDVAAASGMPYLHAATSGVMEDRVQGDPARFARVFQVCPSDVHYGPRFVAFVTELRDRRVWRPPSNRLLVLAQDTWELIDFGLGRAADLAAASGWELVVRPPGGHWAAAGAAASAGEPAAVMVGSYLVDDHVAFVDGFRSSPSPSLIYAIYAPSVPEYRTRLGRRADGVLWATTTGTYPDRLGQAFATRYAARFGVLPGRSHAGIAYDRTRLVAQAWAAADFRDFGAVAARLRTTVHRGVNGSYAFDGPGQTALGWDGDAGRDPSLAQAHLVHQIQGGRHRVVSPRPYADGAFALPPWIGG